MVEEGWIREYDIRSCIDVIERISEHFSSSIFLFLIIILLPLQVKNDVYQQIDISVRDREEIKGIE